MSSLAREQAIAISAVLKACRVARKVQAQLVNANTQTKSDNSPVTVADYASQALICKLLTAHFPDWPIVGEEDSKDLKSPAQSDLRKQITALANWALVEGQADSNDDAWSIVGKEPLEESTWINVIDKGSASQTKTGTVWALDPIDGTKGFLRNGQYAVCLALLQDGKPVLGVMGCPNLPVDPIGSESEMGAIFVGCRGQGAFLRSLSSPDLRKISFNSIQNPADASFCESVEAGHSDQSTNAKIASILGIDSKPVRMDSQAKYCSISRGDGDIYLRLPVRADYQEKIWDHASGVVLVEEAGGKVTDCHGKELDFSLGRTLRDNKGIVASAASIHGKVIEAVKEALVAKQTAKD